MDRTITFRVDAAPVPQPRKRGGINPRTGKQCVYTPKGARITTFRQSVTLATRLAVRQPYTGPVSLRLVIILPRPASLGNQFPDAGRQPAWHRGRGGDGDNYEKGIADAMKGFAFVDDSQIWSTDRKKVYAAKGEKSGVEIELTFHDVGSTC